MRFKTALIVSIFVLLLLGAGIQIENVEAEGPTYHESPYSLYSLEISQNETWCAADSPHIVNQSLKILENTTLTIESNATVWVNAGESQIFGDLIIESGACVVFNRSIAILGNLTICSNARVNFSATGPWSIATISPSAVWVEGNLTIGSGAEIKLSIARVVRGGSFTVEGSTVRGGSIDIREQGEADIKNCRLIETTIKTESSTVLIYRNQFDLSSNSVPITATDVVPSLLDNTYNITGTVILFMTEIWPMGVDTDGKSLGVVWFDCKDHFGCSIYVPSPKGTRTALMHYPCFGLTMPAYAILSNGTTITYEPFYFRVEKDGVVNETIIDTFGIKEITFVLDLPKAELFINNITLSNDRPEQGNNVTITANVENAGEKEATNVTVSFFIDDTLIGNKTIPTILAGELEEASVNWVATKGKHIINVTIVTASSEHNKYNNEKSVELNVNVKEKPPTYYVEITIIIIILILIGAGAMILRKHLHKKD